MEALNCSSLHESGVKLGTLHACSSELPAHFLIVFFLYFFLCKMGTMGYPHLYLQCTYLDVQYTSVSKVLWQPAWLDTKNKSGVEALAAGVHGYAVDLKGDVTRSAGSGESFAEKPR